VRSRLSDRSVLILLLAVPLWLLAGCASSKAVRPSDVQHGPSGLKRIAVVSFERLTPSDASRSAGMPIGGTVLPACESSDRADAVVQELFLDRLERMATVSVIPPYQNEFLYRKLREDDPRLPGVAKLVRLGKALEADGVAAGYVSCFRERVGYAYSVQRPASVTFGIYLIRVRDGEIVWGGVYDKTQQSFTENLLQASTFFRRGMKWVTAAELAEDGVDELLKSFPTP